MPNAPWKAVEVTFNIVSGIPTWIIPDNVNVPQNGSGDATWGVYFQLTPNSDAGTEWASDPISWLNGAPPTPGGSMTLAAAGPNQTGFLVLNNNTGSSGVSFPFEISVMKNGTRYTSTDPEVVLDPPG